MMTGDGRKTDGRPKTDDRTPLAPLKGGNRQYGSDLAPL